MFDGTWMERNQSRPNDILTKAEHRASIYIITQVYQALQYISLSAQPNFPYPSKFPQHITHPDLATITKNVTPIPCHSHNDYWRPSPLYSALRTGCTGIEADIWLFSNDLFVGHTTRALRREKTLSAMYIEPLTRILDLQNHQHHDHDHDHRDMDSHTARHERKNGVYPLDPNQTVVLLIDFKNDGHALFPLVSRQLAPLRRRGYLSHFNGSATVQGPITVVVTGNAPFELIIANQKYRDIFYDAPLGDMYEDENPSSSSLPPSSSSSSASASGPRTKLDGGAAVAYDPSNSYYASTSFPASVGWLWWFGHITGPQRLRIRGQIRGAHKRELKARYWSSPAWLRVVRDRVWEVLVEEGIDYLNGDDLDALRDAEYASARGRIAGESGSVVVEDGGLFANSRVEA